MRRFSEFHLLFSKLRAAFPGVVVPPCPEKNQLETFRKNAAFIEARRQALEVFVNKLCAHRVLRHSDLLRTFLEAEETAWAIEVRCAAGRTRSSSGAQLRLPLPGGGGAASADAWLGAGRALNSCTVAAATQSW